MSQAQKQGLVEMDEGRRIHLGPIEIVVKEDGSGTRGNLSVAEFRSAGFRIPPHTHTEHDETILVLEGAMGVRLGEATFTARAGCCGHPTAIIFGWPA